MDIIDFALQGNYRRFYNDLKVLSKTNGKPAWLMFLDTALSTLLLGSGLQDYLNYEFHKKSFKERKTYVNIGYMAKVTPILGNIKYSPFISNKAAFHKNYAKFTKRDRFLPDEDYESFEQFLDRNEQFVLKPQIGLGGEDVKKVSTADIEDKKTFFAQVQQTQAVLEELIIQHDAWQALNSTSVNTLRVMTAAVDGKARIIFASARFGSGKSIADNFHMGGRVVLVDVENGKLTGNALTKKLEESETGENGIRFDGYPIPYWEEVKKMVLEAALVNDEIHLVGWDVALGKNGPLIIEGNRCPGFDVVQVPLRKGARYMIEELLEEVQKAEKK